MFLVDHMVQSAVPVSVSLARHRLTLQVAYCEICMFTQLLTYCVLRSTQPPTLIRIWYEYW